MTQFLEENNKVNISFQEELSTLNKNMFTILEWDVLNNNYTNVMSDLQSGSTNYYFNNGKINKLCNGHLYNNGLIHPQKCIADKCYETAMLYGLQSNCRAYNTLYGIIKEIYKDDNNLRRKCKCCHTLDELNNYNKFSKALNDIIDGFISAKCVCRLKSKYLPYYAEDFLNFLPVYDIFYDKIIAIKEYCEQQLGAEMGPLNYSKFYLNPLDTCIHDGINFYKLVYCKKDNKDDDDMENSNKLIELSKKFLMVCEFYKINVEICKTLMNQQTLESVNCFVETVDDEEMVISIQTKLMRDTNPFLDINYENNGIDFLQIIGKDFPKLMSKMLNFGMGYKKSLIGLIENAIDKELPNVLKYLFDNIKKNEIGTISNESILVNKLVNPKISLSIDERLEYIEKLMKLGFPYTNYMEKRDIFGTSLECNPKESNDMIDGLFDILNNHNLIFDNIDPKNLLYSLSNGTSYSFKKLINGGVDINSTIVVDSDNSDERLVIALLKSNVITKKIEEYVNILISYGCDIDVNDSFGNNPLHLSIKKGLLSVVDILLHKSININQKTSNCDTILHLSIKYNQVELANKFIAMDFEYDIINSKNDNDEVPTDLCLGVNAFEILLMLCNNKKLIVFENDLLGKVFGSNLSDNEKIQIVYVLDKIHDLEKVLSKTKKPLLIRAVEFNNFNVVRTLFFYLIDSGKIILKKNNVQMNVDDVDFITLINDKNIIIDTIESINYYSIVLMYLKVVITTLFKNNNYIDNQININKINVMSSESSSMESVEGSVKELDSVNSIYSVDDIDDIGTIDNSCRKDNGTEDSDILEFIIDINKFREKIGIVPQEKVSNDDFGLTHGSYSFEYDVNNGDNTDDLDKINYLKFIKLFVLFELFLVSLIASFNIYDNKLNEVTHPNQSNKLRKKKKKKRKRVMKKNTKISTMSVTDAIITNNVIDIKVKKTNSKKIVVNTETSPFDDIFIRNGT
jgi:ankyrin repeat protein